jgi:hypothetical protein
MSKSGWVSWVTDLKFVTLADGTAVGRTELGWRAHHAEGGQRHRLTLERVAIFPRAATATEEQPEFDFGVSISPCNNIAEGTV